MNIGCMCLRYFMVYVLLLGWIGTLSAQTEAILTFDEVLKNGSNAVDGLFGAADILITSDSVHVYIVGQTDDDIGQFRRNKTTGKLTFIEVKSDNIGDIDGLDGVSAVAISPDEKHIYTVGIFDDAVSVFERNTSSGQLTFVEFKKDI